MTAETRFDRELPAILEDLYLGPSPDYRDEVMAAAIRTRQRPTWTFAGRWFPMADIATRPLLAPRVPLRTIGAALIVIALVVVAALTVVGSRQTKVPPPFGPARNGLITYAAEGDIYTVDPQTGVATAIVTGATVDAEPVFSHDGTHIAFRRVSQTTATPAEDIVVVDAAGRNAVVVTDKPIPSGPKGIQWAPDSRSLLAGAPDDSTIWLFDATAATAPRIVATEANSYVAAFRPPDGESILIARQTQLGSQVIRLDLADGREMVLAKGGSDNDFGAARWSPDGSQVVYNNSPADDGASERLFVVNADGTGTRQITDAPGTWFDIDMTWSPDGSRIAFLRYQFVDQEWLVRPIGIYSVATGTVIDAGPLARDVREQAPNPADQYASAGEGMFVEWSPDSSTVIAYPSEASGHAILINPVDGTWQVLAPVTEPTMPSQAWQRLAR